MLRHVFSALSSLPCHSVSVVNYRSASLVSGFSSCCELNFAVEMFGSIVGHARGHGSSGVAVAMPFSIPKRFVWPHGGRRVFLTGSFTRWSAFIPMSPMEGCPTVFQVVCRLTPGYHQYKFNVDGVWRHDVYQPFVSGDYGTVNKIYIVREPDIFPLSTLSAETSGRSRMEVDNAVSQYVEAYPRMSESDLQVSRCHISMFLSAHTAYELLPESGKVVVLDITLPIKHAFHALYEQGISMAPLWDSSKCQFVGMFSVTDFILILKLRNLGSNLTEEQLEAHTIAAWKEARVQECRTDNNGSTCPQHFVHAGPHECLKDVAVKILQNNVTTVPIIHSSSEDGSFPQLLHLASLSGILTCICRHFKHCSGSLPILQQPIGSIPLGTWVPKVGESNKKPVAMLRPNASLDDALSLLIQAEVSSVPIVDGNGSLVDIYSRSDITALVKDKAYARINLDRFSIHQALLLGRYTNSPFRLSNGPRCHMCLRSDSLHKVMERLANPGVRRLMVVEAGSRRVEGIITLRDIFRFLLG
ncbi:hypothetical protein RJT34_22957 [Clitoria ternatea]|uniref:CBS domain-containing protein n=1 Tax=Clitoria ternatea TaxID=43366 RepID=A0AAN9FK30_CLITE